MLYGKKAWRRGLIAARFQEDNDLSLDTAAANAASTDAVRMTASSLMTSETILSAVIASLEDDKAEDIVQIDLRGRSEMGDWMVIASGRSSRQVAAISEKLMDRLKQEFGIISKIEGKDTGDWVLIDTGDVIVHVFRPEVREFYQLEKMWMPTGSERAMAEKAGSMSARTQATPLSPAQD
jgi:ribosome-associated protein